MLVFDYFSGVNRWEKANFWQSSENSLYFKANDDNANFDNRANLADANDNYSGGLLFIGLCLNKSQEPLYKRLLCQPPSMRPISWI